MWKKILFLILTLVSFSLLIYIGGIPKAGEKVFIKEFRPIPFNPKPAFSAYFIRGDANADGEINAGDIIYLIVYFFRDGPPPPTLEHGDANGDGVINVADIIFLKSYLFLNGPAPPPYQ